MRLIACPQCRTQYDVSQVPEGGEVRCSCGTMMRNSTRAALDAPIERCSSCGAPVKSDAKACEFCRAEIIRDRERLHLHCPECFAKNAESARYCAGCGVAFAPQVLPSVESDRACPDCQKPLYLRKVAGVDVEECSKCYGLWVQTGGFDELVGKSVAARRAAMEGEPGEGAGAAPRHERGNPLNVKVRYRRCPVCQHHMARQNWRQSSGVVLDVCREHGTWLDADELERLAGFVLSGGWEKANLRDAKKADAAATGLPPAPSRADAPFTQILMEQGTERGRRTHSGAPLLEVLVRALERIL